MAFSLILPLIILISSSSAVATSYFPVTKFGANPNGKTDATKPFLEAWNSACHSGRPAVVYVPKGRFLLKTAIFYGPCKNSLISFRIDGTLIAVSNYNLLYPSGTWIRFEYVHGLSIYGRGTIDGQGASLWACKRAHRSCPFSAKSLSIGHSSKIRISGLKFINSKLFHMFIYGSKEVSVNGCKFIAPGNSPNTDGIHIQYSSGITIRNSQMMTGDDCISIGPGSSNVWIQGIFCGPGHGISIGSLGHTKHESGVSNVTVKKVKFSGTTNGIRIKTWGRPSNGFVKKVTFDDITMSNVRNPIHINQNYCPHNRGCPNKHSGIKITGVVFSNVKGSSSTPVVVKFDCSKTHPCTNIKLHNINLTYMKKTSLVSCKHASGRSSKVRFLSKCL